MSRLEIAGIVIVSMIVGAVVIWLIATIWLSKWWNGL